jgi:hypothetical protein
VGCGKGFNVGQSLPRATRTQIDDETRFQPQRSTA